MESLVIKIKSEQAAQRLADFLKTLDYVEAVEQRDEEVPQPAEKGLIRGEYAPGEKPSDFAGIWAGRKKVDANKLRQKAWQRKK